MYILQSVLFLSEYFISILFLCLYSTTFLAPPTFSTIPNTLPHCAQPEEDLEAQPSASYGQVEVKIRTQGKPKKNRKKSKKDDSEFVFMDRQSIIDARNSPYPDEVRHLSSQPAEPSDDPLKVLELPSSPKKHQPRQHPLHLVRRHCVYYCQL